jgi:hypothetical protein
MQGLIGEKGNIGNQGTAGIPVSFLNYFKNKFNKK